MQNTGYSKEETELLRSAELKQLEEQKSHIADSILFWRSLQGESPLANKMVEALHIIIDSIENQIGVIKSLKIEEMEQK